MEKPSAPWTLTQLAQLLGGEAIGDPGFVVHRPASSGDDDPIGITFAESDVYLAKAEASTVGAVIVGRGQECAKPSIQVDVPRMAFFQLLHLAARPPRLPAGIHPTAVVGINSVVDASASIGPYVVIGDDAVIGAGAQIFPFCYVGDRCRVGEKTTLNSHVTLYADVEIGASSVIHSSTVIGADGFGYVFDGTKQVKLPQVGGVQIGDHVEIGANTCIDRATAGFTTIGRGTKIDNLVQIGHNCHIGEHTVIAGMCGIPGSVTIGDRCVLAGGVDTNDHVTITDDVTLGGRAGVDRDITESGQYFGTPARPAAEAVRTLLLTPKLPEIWSRLKKLERQVGGSNDV